MANKEIKNVDFKQGVRSFCVCDKKIVSCALKQSDKKSDALGPCALVLKSNNIQRFQWRVKGESQVCTPRNPWLAYYDRGK